MAEAKPAWPSVEEQLAAAKVVKGSALERLIRENQDFRLLRADEADDKVGLPPWIRVHWRKHHPEGAYATGDPTGGYPRALKRLHAWMLLNQDLPPGSPANRAIPGAPSPPAAPKAVGRARRRKDGKHGR